MGVEEIIEENIEEIIEENIEEIIEENIEEIIEENIVENDYECPICSNIPKDITKTFVCSHKFCQLCVYTWNVTCVKSGHIVSCPLCRTEDPNTTFELRNWLVLD